MRMFVGALILVSEVAIHVLVGLISTIMIYADVISQAIKTELKIIMGKKRNEKGQQVFQPDLSG